MRPVRTLVRRPSIRRKPRPLACEALEARRLLANPNGIVTTGVYDENVVDPNTVDYVATGSSLTNAQFAGQVATAFSQDMGGVIAGGLGALYNYGATQDKTLILEPSGGTSWATGTGYHISGPGAFSTSGPSYNSLSLDFVQIQGALPYEHVVTFGLTALSISGRDYGIVTVAGHLAGGGSVSASRTINDPTKAGDTFFGLSAPSGDYFTGFSLSYSGAVFGTPDTGLWFDDIGFITSQVDRVNNLPPVAADDSYNAAQNQTTAIGGAGVLANDSDPDGNPLSTILVSGPAHGSFLLNPEGAFWYTPAAGYVGPDSFTYRAFDTQDTSGIAAVTLNVIPPNRPPVAGNDSYAVTKNQALTVAAPGVLGNDTDPDGNPLTARLVSGPGHGTVALAADGSFTYTPAANYLGPDGFTYQAGDGSLSSNTATVNLNVSGPDDPPVANNDAFTMNWNATLTIQPPGVLANDSDLKRQPLTAINPTQPAHGTLTLNANGSFTYTPAANYSGPDSFTYQASDGTLASNAATVNITVQQVFTPPTAVADRYATPENTPLTVAAPGLLANDGDPEGDPLTPLLVSGPAHAQHRDRDPDRGFRRRFDEEPPDQPHPDPIRRRGAARHRGGPPGRHQIEAPPDADLIRRGRGIQRAYRRRAC
jgi:VCBS repeat-containing protein